MKLMRHLPCLGLAWLLATTAAALPDDRDQPIEITADSAVQEGDTITYSGDVLIVQGSLRIEGDRVVVVSQDRRVRELVATGNPARLQQQQEADAAEMRGRALRITYRHTDSHVIFEREAHVEQDGSSLSGDRIDYFPETETVRAQGADNGGERVRMILQPEREAGN